jgi:uncharacterized protein YggE
MKQKFWVILSSLLVVALLAACSSTPATTVAAAAPVRTLSANGNGQVYITPDIAYINVGIHTEANDVSTALNDNSTQAQKITDTLTGLSVDKKDIQTTSFNVYPMTTYATDGSVSRKYFAVDNSVYVTVRDLSALGKLLDAVVKSGANTINGITFDVQNKDAAMAQARDLAIQNAKTEAESIAKSAGVTLGDLQTISVSTSGTPNTVYDAKALGGGTSASVPVSAGQLEISVDAALTYSIK